MKCLLVVVVIALLYCTVEGCTTSGECLRNECCVSNMRPIGKRQLASGGSCRPLGKLGGGCLVRESVYDDSRMYFDCPCEPGLTCKGNGMIDIPLGEMGTCAHA